MIDDKSSDTVCSNCGTHVTPLWRRANDGSYLCNACGLYYKIHRSNRPIELKTETFRHRQRMRRSDPEYHYTGNSERRTVRGMYMSPGCYRIGDVFYKGSSAVKKSIPNEIPCRIDGHGREVRCPGGNAMLDCISKFTTPREEEFGVDGDKNDHLRGLYDNEKDQYKNGEYIRTINELETPIRNQVPYGRENQEYVERVHDGNTSEGLSPQRELLGSNLKATYKDFAPDGRFFMADYFHKRERGCHETSTGMSNNVMYGRHLFRNKKIGIRSMSGASYGSKRSNSE